MKLIYMTWRPYEKPHIIPKALPCTSTHILSDGLWPLLWFGLGYKGKHVSDALLLEGVVPLQHPLVKPFGVRDSRNWIFNTLVDE